MEKIYFTTLIKQEVKLCLPNIQVKMRSLTSLMPAAELGGKQDSSSVTLLPGSYNTQKQITYLCWRMQHV